MLLFSFSCCLCCFPCCCFPLFLLAVVFVSCCCYCYYMFCLSYIIWCSFLCLVFVIVCVLCHSLTLIISCLLAMLLTASELNNSRVAIATLTIKIKNCSVNPTSIVLVVPPPFLIRSSEPPPSFLLYFLGLQEGSQNDHLKSRFHVPNMTQNIGHQGSST